MNGSLRLALVLALVIGSMAYDTRPLGIPADDAETPLDASARPQAAAPSIVDGQEATLGAFPWMVALAFSQFSSAFEGLRCGGTLIAREWVLTSAHCVLDGQDKQPLALEVVADQFDLTSNEGIRIGVRDVFPHPEFDRETADYDIALVQLAAPLDLPAVSLSFRDPQPLIQRNAMTTMLGWGSVVGSEEGQRYPHTLQRADVPLAASDLCQASYRRQSPKAIAITDRMLCAGTLDNAQDACTGDSGGPLLYWDPQREGWVQIGIISWGIGCAIPGFLGVYADVSEFETWIEDVIGFGLVQEPTSADSYAPDAEADAQRSLILLPWVP